MGCTTKKNTNLQICSGDLNKRITIFNRTIQPPSGQSVDYTEIFSIPTQVWAMIETIKGIQIFDGTNIISLSTHRFTIRYQKSLDVDIQKWVQYASKRYKIIDVQNQNEQNKFIIINATLRGADNLPVNLQ